MTTFTTRYNYKPSPGLVNKEESRTFQECKNDCDINHLYRKYLSKGFEPPNIQRLEQRYADITNAKSYEESLNIQEDVKQLFETLPADVREACDYNVDTFMEVIGQPHEDEEIKKFQNNIFDKLGMLERKETFDDIRQAIQEEKLPDIEPIKDNIEKK